MRSVSKITFSTINRFSSNAFSFSSSPALVTLACTSRRFNSNNNTPNSATTDNGNNTTDQNETRISEEEQTQQKEEQNKKKKRFTSTINFKIAPEKVDSENCPSAKDIKQMLPTADELYEQLPTPAEVRAMYDLDRPGAGRAPPTPEAYASQGVIASLKRSVLGALSKDSGLNDKINVVGGVDNKDGSASSTSSASSSSSSSFLDRFSLHPKSTTAPNIPHAMSKPLNGNNKNNSDSDEPALWPDCDTPEDILNEERFGGDGEEVPKPTGEHVTLAWKALLYGTLLASLIAVASGALICWYMGFSSASQLKEHMQGRKAREIEQLKEEARKRRQKERMAGKGGEEEDDEDEDGTVHVYEIDLTNPTTLMQQVEGLVKLVEDLATMEAEKEKAKEEAEAALKQQQERNGSGNSDVSRLSLIPTTNTTPTTNTLPSFIDMRTKEEIEEEARQKATNALKPSKRSYSL